MRHAPPRTPELRCRWQRFIVSDDRSSSGGQHPLRPRRGGTSIKGSWPGGPGGGGPWGKIADFSTLTRIFHGRRRRGTPRASERFMCQRCGACPSRERLPCRPPGRLRAGAPLQPASWPHRVSSLLSKLFPFIRAAAVGRSRPAESSTSLFDRLGVMSSTGTSQVSSAPSHPSPRSGAFRKK